jgi:hypothetical protein
MRESGSCPLDFYPLSFAIHSTTHTTLLSCGTHNEHLPVIISSACVVQAKVSCRSPFVSRTVTSAGPLIATGIKTIQSSLPTRARKSDQPFWNANNCTLRARCKVFASRSIIALTMLVICNSQRD